MKIYIHTNGCAVLKHETERIARFFHLNDVEITGDMTSADIVVMTCCGVTHNEENQAIEIIKELNGGKSPGAMLVVSGCLPAFASQRILEAAPGAMLLTYSQMKQFEQMVERPLSIGWEDVYYNHGHLMIDEVHRDDAISARGVDYDLMLANAIDRMNATDICIRQYDQCTLRRYIWQDDDVYQIKVSYGCPGHCAYCATKLAIGEFRSVPKPLVLKQFKEGMAAGYSRFSLIGDEIGCYGTDFGENLVALLDEVHNLSRDIKVSIRYIHPDIFVNQYSGLKPHLLSGFIDFFCCAIQSGSPKILKAMNRNPDIEPFIRCMEDLNNEHCKVNKHTQILVGYPGETDEDIWKTLCALLRCDFDHININIFSPRQGTAAFELAETVSNEDKEQRGRLIRQVMMMCKKSKLYDAIKESFYHD